MPTPVHELFVARCLLYALRAEVWALILLPLLLFLVDWQTVVTVWCVVVAIAILTWLKRKSILRSVEFHTHCDDDPD